MPSIEITVFTGEELTLKLLKEGIKYAADGGFIVKLVTNAWWASSRERALTFLKELGLKELNVSYDDFHSAFIQGRNIVNAVKAALRLGLKVAVAIIVHKYSKINKNYVRNMFVSNGVNVAKIYFLEDHLQPVGRASSLDEKFSTKSMLQNVLIVVVLTFLEIF